MTSDILVGYWGGQWGRYRRGDIYGVAFPIVSNLAGSFLLGRSASGDLYNDKNAKGKLCVRHKGDTCRIKIHAAGQCLFSAKIPQIFQSNKTSWCLEKHGPLVWAQALHVVLS